MNYTQEDFEALLEALEEYGRILVADHELGLPTIHEVPNARHLLMGVFSAECSEYKVVFDAGGAMRRTSDNGISWTPLSVDRGEYPYDAGTARARIEELIDEV